MNSSSQQIVIRVYGLVINDRNQVLLTDEYLMDMEMTKFPGGGLIPGEGPAECMHREALEEFGQPVEILSHYYTTDFYQKAFFYPNHQLVSIYYKIKFPDPISFEISDTPFAFGERIEGSQSFRWESIKSLNPEDLTFPIDKMVAEMLKKDLG